MVALDSNSSAHSEGADAEQILKQFDAYIITLARKMIPRKLVPPEVLDLEIDELAQKVRIKIWHACQSSPIINPKAYINRVVRNESIDMLRQYRPMPPLPLDDDGELYQGEQLVRQSEEMQDPATVLEGEETLADYILKAVDGILALPPCQEQAIICSLKDQVDDVARLIRAFKERNRDIEGVNWPAEKRDRQRLNASLTVSRQKLRLLKQSR
jgi:DNA-directed RNA polymerase specialized sigma24 family protein